jgi:hypothetical protein
MNKAAQQLGRLGGKARSEAKTNANRINAQRYWDAVRAGTAKGPRRGKALPILKEKGSSKDMPRPK